MFDRFQTTTMANITAAGGSSTITTGSTGGYIYTTNGTSASPHWSDVMTLNTSIGPNTLQVKGDAEFEGEIKLKGKSLNDTLSRIEERLAILHPNEKLEEKWEKLKELGKQYRELEVDILEKEKIMEILKR